MLILIKSFQNILKILKFSDRIFDFKILQKVLFDKFILLQLTHSQ